MNDNDLQWLAEHDCNPKHIHQEIERRLNEDEDLFNY